MQDDRKISLVIPNYNRSDMLIEAFEKVYSDERISEIVISDDCSDESIYSELEDLFRLMPKVKMYRNKENQDCYRNKRRSVSLATNDWGILFDSDNVLDKDYIDKIYSIKEWDEKTIYAPTFAMPTFDYREYAGVTLAKENIRFYVNRPMLMTALNTCNFFINRSEYLKIWDGSIDPVTSDSEYFNMCWLSAGNLIYFVPELQYSHRVWDGSHYRNNEKRTPEHLHNEIIAKLREMV